MHIRLSAHWRTLTWQLFIWAWWAGFAAYLAFWLYGLMLAGLQIMLPWASLGAGLCTMGCTLHAWRETTAMQRSIRVIDQAIATLESTPRRHLPRAIRVKHRLP